MGLLSIWAILGGVLFVLSMKEAVLPSLSLVLVSIPIPALVISLVFRIVSEAHCLGLPSLVAALAGYFLAVLY